MARGIILAVFTLFSALAISHGLKCYVGCDSKTPAGCGGELFADSSNLCDETYKDLGGNEADPACVKLTMYDPDSKEEYTVKSCSAKGDCKTLDALMELATACGHGDSKKMAAAYKCNECTADNCNGTTELRAGGVMAAILVSATTILSVRN